MDPNEDCQPKEMMNIIRHSLVKDNYKLVQLVYNLTKR